MKVMGFVKYILGLGRGAECFGPDEVEKVFGVKLVDVPPIPFSQTELQRARKLGQILVLFVPKDADDNPLTIKRLRDMLSNKLGHGKFLNDNMSWYANEAFYTTTSVADKPVWKLVNLSIITDSLQTSYLGQTFLLANYLINEVYRGKELPAVYQSAIRELENSREELIRCGWFRKEGTAERFTELQVNQNHMLSAGELLYVVALYWGIKKKYFLSPDRYAWTTSCTSNGQIVFLGCVDAGGVKVFSENPWSYAHPFCGTLFSRSGLREN